MNQPYRIKFVLFDFDGTLTLPGAIDFALIRQRIGCPDDMAILEFIQTLSDESRRQEAIQGHRLPGDAVESQGYAPWVHR